MIIVKVRNAENATASCGFVWGEPDSDTHGDTKLDELSVTLQKLVPRLFGH
jgi:hypothetical protein